jgi:hypothetical protein
MPASHLGASEKYGYTNDGAQSRKGDDVIVT